MLFYFMPPSVEIAKVVAQDPDVILFVDLESLGKQKRQGHLKTWKSKHSITHVNDIREACPDTELLVRIDPLNINSQEQVDNVIRGGANAIMLPMFHDIDEVKAIVELVNGRTRLVPLFETISSLKILEDAIRLYDIKDLHFGLNDLSLDLGYNFLFEVISNGILEESCSFLRSNGIDFGIGGVARSQEGVISPEYLLGEHVRLGSTRVILSQTFHRNPKDLNAMADDMNFSEELSKLKKIYSNFSKCSDAELKTNQLMTNSRIKDVSNLIHKSK